MTLFVFQFSSARAPFPLHSDDRQTICLFPPHTLYYKQKKKKKWANQIRHLIFRRATFQIHHKEIKFTQKWLIKTESISWILTYIRSSVIDWFAFVKSDRRHSKGWTTPTRERPLLSAPFLHHLAWKITHALPWKQKSITLLRVFFTHFYWLYRHPISMHL